MAGKTVVCVEDDESVLELINLVLRDPRFNMVTALGGRKGLEVIRSVRPDLVMLDLFMPDLSGWEVYDQIRRDRKLRNTKVVVLSAYQEEVASALAPTLTGVDDYICKPFSLARLRSAVDEALDLANSESLVLTTAAIRG